MKSTYVYKRFERFWHWTQAALILFLAVTGFEVHGTIQFFGFEKAVAYHRLASWMLLGLIIFAVFWHLTTGEWRHYMPTTKKLKEQVLYYLKGMFLGEPHPTHKISSSKLNPLQVLVYLGFKLILIPITILSGFAYLFHKRFDDNGVIIIQNISLESIALWHTMGAFLLFAFLIGHIYMTTTGDKLTTNLRAMITGYEVIPDASQTKDKESDQL